MVAVEFDAEVIQLVAEIRNFLHKFFLFFVSFLAQKKKRKNKNRV